MYTPKGELNDNLLKLVQTEGVLAKFAEAQDPEVCYEIAKEAGVEITKEEFVANMEIMKSYLEEQEEGLLSEDDLDQVAGGKMSTNDAVEVTLVAISAGAGVIGAIAGVVGAATAAI